MVPLSGHGRRPGPAGARPLPPRSGACRRRAVGAARPRRRGRGARRGVSGCVWGTRRSQKVTLLVALNFCAPLRHAMADACTDPCSCTLLRSHPAACDTRPRALYRPWRTQHRSHDKRLSVRRPAPGHRRRGRDCRHALPSPHVVARRRRRPVAGSSCRLRLLTRQRSWRRRGSAGGGVSAVDTLHERAQHAAPAGTAAGRSVEGRPRMHECYTRECGVNAASRPAPRGARARCPRRAVSARLRVVCERTVLTLPHGGLLSCCEGRHSLLSPVPPPGNMRTASQA
jgi:hypothetical protein